MPQVIIWENEDGGVAICRPIEAVDDVLASGAVPSGAKPFIVDEVALPDPKYSAAWSLGVDGSVEIDATKKALIDSPVPQTAPAGDFLRALYELGWYADVDAAVKQVGGLAEILWNRASIFERGHPIVVQIGTAIGKSSADLDDLFRKSATY